MPILLRNAVFGSEACHISPLDALITVWLLGPLSSVSVLRNTAPRRVSTRTFGANGPIACHAHNLKVHILARG